MSHLNNCISILILEKSNVKLQESDGDVKSKILDLAIDIVRAAMKGSVDSLEDSDTIKSNAIDVLGISTDDISDDDTAGDDTSKETTSDTVETIVVDNEPGVYNILDKLVSGSKISGSPKTELIKNMYLSITPATPQDLSILKNELSFYISKDVPVGEQAIVNPEIISDVESIKLSISGMSNAESMKKDIESVVINYGGVVTYVD